MTGMALGQVSDVLVSGALPVVLQVDQLRFSSFTSPFLPSPVTSFYWEQVWGQLCVREMPTSQAVTNTESELHTSR